ncbi:hypothetical protein BGZ89_003934, partial [Linnemannia elongata]
ARRCTTIQLRHGSSSRWGSTTNCMPWSRTNTTLSKSRAIKELNTKWTLRTSKSC